MSDTNEKKNVQEILWDLWKDCVAYDVAHPGATRANRLRGAFGLARHMLLEVLAARREDDLDFFSCSE